MKLQGHANKLITNATEAQTQNFGIGDASVVISILRDKLYMNKIQTLVQEYICNARDAVREIGKQDFEFEITIPTELNPVFKVRDFGPGISPDRMANVFVLYGASTKRGTNGLTGGFGIGAKSAWSYTDSFTIVTVVDGMKRSYIAHTGVDNNGRLDLVSAEKTSEKDGTEIQVSVKQSDIREFKDAVFRAIYFWEKRPFIKGRLDIPNVPELYKPTARAGLFKRSSIPSFVHNPGWCNESVLAVIDGVPYPLSEKLLNRCPNLYTVSKTLVASDFVLFLDNGIVEVSANRESIADSHGSLTALESIGKAELALIKQHIQEKVSNVNSLKEFIDNYRSMAPYFYISEMEFVYDGFTIKNNSLKSDLLASAKITHIHNEGRRGRVSTTIKKENADIGKAINIDNLNGSYYLLNDESAVVQNRRVRELFDGNLRSIYLFEVSDKALQSKFEKLISKLEMPDFQSLALPEVEKVEKVKVTRDKQQFCLHVLDGHRYRYTTLSDNHQEWLYLPITDKGWEYGTDLLTAGTARELEDYLKNERGLRICGVADRALNMVQGDKNFSSLKDWLAAFKPTKKEISFAKLMKASNKDVMDRLIQLKGIEDAELNDLVKEYKTIFQGNTNLPDLLHKKVQELKEVKEFIAQDEKVAKLISTKYTLLSELSGYARGEIGKDLVIYINAKFAIKE